MVGISGGGGGGGGYDYVQDGTPASPVEGEEWYDTGANAAYVYDGANWIEQTVTDHGQLSGVTGADHHAKPTGTGSTAGGPQKLRTQPNMESEKFMNVSNNNTNTSLDLGFPVKPVYVTDVSFTVYYTNDNGDSSGNTELRTPSGTVLDSANIGHGNTYTFSASSIGTSMSYITLWNSGTGTNYGGRFFPRGDTVSFSETHSHTI